MEDQLKQYLKEFVETLKQGGELALEQLPLFIHEYINWSIAIHVIYVVVSVVLLYIGYRLSKNLFTEYSKPKEHNRFLTDDTRYSFESYNVNSIGAMHNIFTPISLVIGLPLFLINVYQLSMVLIAPRVYLIKNLMEML